MKTEKIKKEKKQRIKNFFTDFKNFINKGNVLNLAIAFVMGAAFNAIVTSLVNDLIMPLVSILFGKTDIGSLAWVVSGDLTIYYGKFILAVVQFLIIAFTLFLVIKIAAGAENSFKKLGKREKKVLKENGLTNEEIAAAEQEAAAAAAAAEPTKPTSEELLADILAVLKAQGSPLTAQSALQDENISEKAAE